MTKKEINAILQRDENKTVLDMVARFNVETRGVMFEPWKRLRSCSAHVSHVLHYYVLMSYQTIIAVIDTDTDTMYDFLRYVYGYTSTSAQHLSKFDHDYGAGKWGCTYRYTYKEV